MSGSNLRRARQRCVVIFASEDDDHARSLVDAVSAAGFDGWSSHQIAQGKWNVVVEDELATCDAVVPLVTGHTRDKPIFHDEWQIALVNKKPVFPFALDPNGTPIGFGQFSYTDARGWDGSANHPSISTLCEKLRRHFGPGAATGRPTALSLGDKRLELPSFAFSLSSFETQLDPVDGLELISSLAPPAALVSAYDLHLYLRRSDRRLRQTIVSTRDSRTVVFLDSGNYEATRKRDHASRSNRDGWSRSKFCETASALPAEIVFTYDPPIPEGKFEGLTAVVADIVDRYVADAQDTGLDCSVLCPIVHVPPNLRSVAEVAASLVRATAEELRPTFVAIPERELGDGLLERMRTVKTIRRRLDERGFYQPLHILGTGNPVSIAALAACGGDSFDGLEWCRTAANYDTNGLMHLQQFDCLLSAFGARMRNPDARALAEFTGVGSQFALRAAAYNYDYFEGWMRSVQKWIRNGDAEELLRGIPSIGFALADVFREEAPK